MKNMSKMDKILCVLIAVVILVGIAVTAIVGLRFELKYEKATRIEIYIGKDFDLKDVKSIANEVFQNRRTIVQKVELYNDMVSIIVENPSDEEIDSLVQKFNEKYELENTKDDINIVEVPHTRGRYIVRPYILPVVISTLIIALYLCVFYYKQGVLKILAKAIFTPAVLELLALSVIAICRIPVGRITILIGLFVYLLAVTYVTCSLEKKRKVLDSKEKKKSK